MSQLPNFAFSVPLAMFLQGESQSSEDTTEADEKVHSAAVEKLCVLAILIKITMNLELFG